MSPFRLGRGIGDAQTRREGQKLTSFDPRPKPEMTLPSMRSGYGASGPASGPTMSGRTAAAVVSVDDMSVCIYRGVLGAAFSSQLARSSGSAPVRPFARLSKLICRGEFQMRTTPQWLRL